MTTEQRRAEALGLVAESALAAGRPPVLPYLEDGINVSAETCRRLACDSSLVVMRHDAGGAILDVGRRTRTIPRPYAGRSPTATMDAGSPAAA